jgi:hypothetical protein
VGAVPVLVQARNTDALARPSGVDEAPLTDIDAVVPEAVKKYQVARLEAVAGDRGPVLVLHRGVVRERDADLSVDVPHEAGAIEAGGPRTTPSIRGATVLHRKLHRAVAPMTLRASNVDQTGRLGRAPRDAGAGGQRHGQAEEDSKSLS